MKKEKLDNVIDFRQVENDKKYFLVVSDTECVLECWANNYMELAGIVNIYDSEGNPHKVNMIIDVAERHVYEIKRED